MGTPPTGVPGVPCPPRSPQPSPSGLERSQLLFVGSHFPSLPFSARFYYIYLCVCLSGRRSYFNFFRILNKRSGGGGCGGRPCIPHPLRSERGLIGDNDLDGADRWKTSEPPQGWRGLAASLRWDAAVGAEPPPKRKNPPPPTHPGGLGNLAPPWGALGGRQSGARVGLGSPWFGEAPVGVWLGDAAGCARRPLAPAHPQRAAFWGEKPLKKPTCV